MGNYDEAVKMMGDTAFLSSLINFPKEAITDETVELLRPYFKAPDFNFDSAKKVCSRVLGKFLPSCRHFPDKMTSHLRIQKLA